jgi:hypothetical protein
MDRDCVYMKTPQRAPPTHTAANRINMIGLEVCVA